MPAACMLIISPKMPISFYSNTTSHSAPKSPYNVLNNRYDGHGYERQESKQIVKAIAMLLLLCAGARWMNLSKNVMSRPLAAVWSNVIAAKKDRENPFTADDLSKTMLLTYPPDMALQPGETGRVPCNAARASAYAYHRRIPAPIITPHRNRIPKRIGIFLCNFWSNNRHSTWLDAHRPHIINTNSLNKPTK